MKNPKISKKIVTAINASNIINISKIVIFPIPSLKEDIIFDMIILILLSMFLTFIGGCIPSRKAAKKDPVEALRSE